MFGKKKKNDVSQTFNPKTGFWTKIVGGKFESNSKTAYKGVKKR